MWAGCGRGDEEGVHLCLEHFVERQEQGVRVHCLLLIEAIATPNQNLWYYTLEYENDENLGGFPTSMIGNEKLKPLQHQWYAIFRIRYTTKIYEVLCAR